MISIKPAFRAVASSAVAGSTAVDRPPEAFVAVGCTGCLRPRAGRQGAVVDQVVETYLVGACLGIAVACPDSAVAYLV